MAKKYWWEEDNNTTQAGEQPQNQGKKIYWWEPEAVASTVGNDITNRVNAWAESNKAYISDYQNRFSNRKFNYEDAYVSDSANWAANMENRGNSLTQDAQSIIAYVDQYEEFLDKEFVDYVKSTLNSTTQQYGQFIDYAKKDSEYWSQWETEDDYKSYLEQAKNRDKMLSYDLGAGAKEIDGLRRVGDHYSNISNLYANYLNGLLEVYEPENTETLEEDYAAYEQYNPNAFEYEYDENGRLVDSVQNKYQIKGRYITKEGLNKLVAEYEILSKKYGNYGDLAATITEKEQYHNQAKRAQEGAKLASVSGNADFKDYSGYDGSNKDDALYEYINGNIKYNFNVGPYDHMNKDEIGIFNYYYAKEGKDAAEKYLKSIEESLNYRMAEDMYADMEGNYIKEIFFHSIVGYDQFTSGVKGLYNAVTGNEEYVPISATQIAGGMAREDLGNLDLKWYNFKEGEWDDANIFGNSLGQVMADATSTTFNMLPSVLTSTAINFVAPGVGSVVGTTLLGASAGGNAYQEMINLGYSKGQARNYAVLVGGSEAILQYALGGISSLSGGNSNGIFQSVAGKWLPHVDNAFARVAIKLGSNMLDEGLEEGIQEILNPWFKNLTLNTNEKVNWNDVAYSTLLGALTAGFMEGGSTIYGDVKTYKTGKKLQAADISAARLAEIGKTFSADTVAYQLADKVNENTGAYTMGRLFNEIGATLTTQNVNEITTALMESGMDAETAKKNAEALAYVVEGGQLSDQQVAIIEANDVLAAAARTTLIDANTTWNQRAKGYNDTLKALADEMTSKKTSKAKQAKQVQENAPVTYTVDGQTEIATESHTEAEEVDTSPAKVKNISDISKKTIKLEDGSEVNVKDADLSPDDGVRIETIASIDGISTEDANFVLNKLRSNTGASAQMDSLGAKEVYKYGFYGFSQDHIAKHGVFANSLTESQRQAIYETGRKARQKQIDNASPKATTKQRGIYFDHGSGKVVAFKDADKSIFSEKKRSAGVQAAVILNKMGIGGDIYFFESYRNSEGKLVYKDSNGKEKKAPNGWFSESDGSIHIDLNAGAKGEGLVLFTIAHELTHFIEKWSPKKYKILADFLIENYEKGQSMDKLVRAKQAYLSNMRKKAVSYDEAYSEVIADSMEAMLADGNVIEKIMELKAKDSDLVMKIKQFFDNLLTKIRNAYKGLTPDSAEGKAVLEMTDSIERIQQLFAEALVEASDNFQTAQEQFSTDSIRGNADGAVVQSEVTTALVEATDGEILKSERTEYEALPKQVMSLSTGAGTLLNFIEGLTPTKLKGLAGKTTNGYTGRDVRAYAMGISGFTEAQIKAVNKFMDTMSEFMTEAGVTYKFIGLQDVKDAKLHYTYNADGSIKSIVLSAMVKNGDYPVNFDLSSICKKRVAMSKLIDKLAVRGSLDSGTVKLTPANIFKINTALKNEGYETACLGCFVESKRYNSLEWAKTFCNKWNAAVKKVNPNATYFGYGDNTFTDDSFTLEQAVKVDEAATKYITTTKVERLANALKKYKAREQAGLPLVEKLSDAAKKRLAKSDTISDELKDKYLNIDVTTLTMADVEFLLENEVLPGASLSNKQAVTEMVKSGEAYQHLLRPSDLLTDRGISKLEALPNFHGVLYGHYGSGTPKLMQSYTPYNSEIALLPANKNSDQTLAEYLYTIAGVRMQSFSDFQIQNIYDYLQMVADLAARKLPAHAYTKEISFAKLLGMTGIKVNLSVMFDIDPMVDKAHAGLTKLNKLVHRGEYAKVVLEDEQGKWVYNIGDYQTQKLFAEAFPDEAKRFLQSIGFGDAVKLQSTPGYSANCGIIGVGYSDLGIFAMLDDNRIRYIIPYHASSLPAEIKVATNIALGTDYTSYQNNMKIAGVVDSNGNAVNWSIKEAYKRLGSGQAVINELNEKVRTEGWVVTTKKAQTGHGTYGLYEDLQKTNDPRKTAGNFMDWCIGNGTLPLFYQFASHENYYKLLYDFNVYDCVTEEYAPQQAVTNTYPTMVDGQVQPGNVTDGGFNTEYFQGAIDKQMAFMDEYSRNLDEDLEELADNLEEGTLFSDRDQKTDVTSWNIDWDEDNHSSIKSQMIKHQDEINAMAPVTEVIFDKSKGKTYAEILDEILRTKFGYKIERQDKATFLFDKEAIATLRRYVGSDEEAAAVISAPYVLKRGKAISGHKNHKGNRYPSVTYAGPVTINGERVNVGVVVLFGDKNRPHSLRVLMPSGKEYVLKKTETDPKRKWASPDGGVQSSTGSASTDKVTQPKPEVKKFSDRDSDGNILSKEQQEFFKDSKVRDANGNLLKVFHGTPKKFTTFRPGTAEGWGEGIYFTDNIEEAKNYGENIVEAYLNITNPFNVDTMNYYDLDYESTKAYQNFDKKYWQRWYDEYDTYEEYRDDGMGVDIDMIYTEYVDVFNQILRELGYDGIIAYQSNNIEGYEIVAFHENQPKLTSNTNPTLSDDMRYQDRADESVSNRSLLANAFEGLAQNDIEKNKIQEYKGKIDLINAEEKKLSELNAKIKELSFSKGLRDTKAIRDLQFEARQTANRINTYDKQLLRLEASKPLQDVLEREKKRAYQKAEQRGKEALNKYKERAAKTQRELLERWQDSRKKGIENREKSYVKEKIKNFKKRLEAMLLKPTDRQYIPIDLINAMVDVCEIINTDTDLYKADGSINKAQERRNLTKEKLQNLKDEYEKLKTNSDPIYAGEFDEMVYAYLTELRDKYAGKHLKDMSLDDLNEMYEILRAIDETLRDARKLIGWGDAEGVYEAGDAIVAEQNQITQKRKNGKRNAAQKSIDTIDNLGLSPVRNVERMSGYNQDSYLLKLFKKFEQGIRKKNKFVMDAYKSFESLTSGKEYDDAIYTEVGGKKYTDVNGRKFGLSKMQMMQAILSYERETANDMNHIAGSGFSFADLDMLRKGKLKDAISEEYSHRIPAAVEMVAEFQEVLKDDKWCQDYMAAARKFFNETAKDAINETSIILKHRIIAKDKSYIPFEVDKNFVVREISAENDIQQTINSYGMLKDTKKMASQPLIITGLNNILDRHIDQVGNIYGLAVEVRNFNKVWNVRSVDEVGNDPTVKTAVQRNWGVEGVKHIEQTVQDIQGPRVRERSALYDKVKSGYIAATFTLNMSVVTKQVGSLFSATSMLKWRDPARMIGNLFYTMANHKKISAEVDKYTATAWMRRQGLSDAELYTLMTEGKKTWAGRLLGKLPSVINPTKWITAMDHAVALSLWRYAKIDTAKRTGLKGEELLKATAEFYDEMVENTQSMSDVLHRPEIQKRGDVISEAFAMFKTDLYQMAGQLQATTGRFMANKTKENGKVLGRTVYSIAMGAIWGQLMTTVFALLRYKPYRDDEDEDVTAASWLKRQGFGLTGDLAGYIFPIFGSEVVGIFENIVYGESDDIVDSLALTAINDLYNSMITIGSSIKEGEMPEWADMQKLVVKALQCFGIPASNAIRTVEAIRLHAKDISNGEFLSFDAGVNRSTKNHIHRIIEAIDEGKLNVARGLFEEALEEQATEAAKGGEFGEDELKEAKSALKSALGKKYKDGEVTEEITRKILSELFDLDDDDIYWTFDIWDYAIENGSSDDYAKFGKFYSAVQTGKNLKTVIKEYTDNGVEAKTLASQITSYFKPLYKEMSKTERAGIKGYLLNAYQLLGYNRYEKSKDIDNWLKD